MGFGAFRVRQGTRVLLGTDSSVLAGVGRDALPHVSHAGVLSQSSGV